MKKAKDSTIKLSLPKEEFATQNYVHDMAEYVVDTLSQQLKEIEDKWLTRFDGIIKTLET